MTKDDLDRVLSSSPVKPVLRTIVEGKDIFVADGFVPPSLLPSLERFGMTATQDEFPLGCFATLWYCDNKVGWAGIMLCDVLHDYGHSNEARQDMRVKSAVALARDELSKKRRMH